MIMYRNFNNYESCISLLQRMSNVECLTLLLAIGKDGISIRPSHFMDESILEKKFFDTCLVYVNLIIIFVQY
jgi:hypothetical protein